jgi:hypothetical protein
MATDYFEVSTLCLLFIAASAESKLAIAGIKRHGIVVLPPGAHGRIDDVSHSRWLSRGGVAHVEPRTEILHSVLGMLEEPAPVGGLAALRFWGQTGERSASWIAAADPIHLETRLHSLRVRSLRPDELPISDLRLLFDNLQATLGGDSGLAFARLGQFGYLRGSSPIDTAPMSASVLHGLPPDDFIPSGDSAVGHHQLLGEVQMVLHDHDVNMKRAETALPSINSLWIWGGGIAPEPVKRTLPLLFANDPLFRGYWNSCMGVVEDWPVDIESALSASSSAFVAVMPEFAPDVSAPALTDCLGQLRRSLVRGRVGSLSLLFRDGLSVDISRWDALRFWRGISSLLEKTSDDD